MEVFSVINDELNRLHTQYLTVLHLVQDTRSDPELHNFMKEQITLLNTYISDLYSILEENYTSLTTDSSAF